MQADRETMVGLPGKTAAMALASSGVRSRIYRTPAAQSGPPTALFDPAEVTRWVFVT